jgi:hypothetical protein
VGEPSGGTYCVSNRVYRIVDNEPIMFAL